MRTALVIEDDDDIRRLLEIVLEQAGFTTESASDGESGLAKAERTAVELITVDVGLPDIDGNEVVARLRQSYTGTIVMISARSSNADMAAGLAAGVDAYLTKPFRPRKLRSDLDTILAGFSSDDTDPA